MPILVHKISGRRIKPRSTKIVPSKFLEEWWDTSTFGGERPPKRGRGTYPKGHLSEGTLVRKKLSDK